MEKSIADKGIGRIYEALICWGEAVLRARIPCLSSITHASRVLQTTGEHEGPGERPSVREVFFGTGGQCADHGGDATLWTPAQLDALGGHGHKSRADFNMSNIHCMPRCLQGGHGRRVNWSQAKPDWHSRPQNCPVKAQQVSSGTDM